MTWALGLLGGIGDILKEIVRAMIFGLQWIFAKWYRAVIAVLIVTEIWLVAFTVPDLVAERDTAQDINANVQRELVAANDGRPVALADLPEGVRALGTTIRNVRIASAAASRAAEQNKARIETRWLSYREEARRENLANRAEYERRVAVFVRRQNAPAATDSGSPDAACLSGAAALPCGVVPNPGFAVVPVTDLERSAAAFAQLNALITFTRGLTEQPVADKLP